MFLDVVWQACSFMHLLAVVAVAGRLIGAFAVVQYRTARNKKIDLKAVW
jgi:uncharacterized membrane protein YecN with MAPEG domain